MWIFFRVILFGAPKPRVSVSVLSGPVFSYLLIILFYLHLPNKIIFPHGVLISFSSLHCAKQGLKITSQGFFLFFKPVPFIENCQIATFLFLFCL